MSLRKASVLELATAAYELEARVLRGLLRRDPEGRWWMGETPLEEWLSAYEGHEAVLILASLSEDAPPADPGLPHMRPGIRGLGLPPLPRGPPSPARNVNRNLFRTIN
jgi:hypothetical protein